MNGPPASAVLAEALAAIDVESPQACVWLGQRRRVGAGAPRHDALGRLRAWLADRLYADVYCTGGIAPPDAAAADPSAASLADALSAANAGRGSAQDGWIVLDGDGDGGSIVLERGGLRVWADAGDVLATDPRPGVRVRLRCPRESRGLADGFYEAYGDAGDGADVPLDRHYWNIRPEGRPALMALITTRLNDTEVPFRYKTLNSAGRQRCDAGVLYTPAHLRASVARLLRPVHAAVRGHLRSHCPAFALPLAPGLAFAEDPPGELSFGQHRCRIVAEALVDAFERGITGAPEREAVVTRRWEEQGLSLARPHLNPGSHADDEPRPIAP